MSKKDKVEENIEIERQIQISTPKIQVTLVTHSPNEDMDYLIKRAREFLNSYNRS